MSWVIYFGITQQSTGWRMIGFTSRCPLELGRRRDVVLNYSAIEMRSTELTIYHE